MLWKYGSLASVLSGTAKAMLIQSRIASSESRNIRTLSVPSGHNDKKLSYRRETARQLHTSFSAHSLIVQLYTL